MGTQFFHHLFSANCYCCEVNLSQTLSECQPLISVKSLETKRYPLLAKLPLPTHCSAEVEIQQGELSEQSKSPLLPHRTVFKCMCLQRRGRVSARKGGAPQQEKKTKTKKPKNNKMYNTFGTRLDFHYFCRVYNKAQGLVHTINAEKTDEKMCRFHLQRHQFTSLLFMLVSMSFICVADSCTERNPHVLPLLWCKQDKENNCFLCDLAECVQKNSRLCTLVRTRP